MRKKVNSDVEPEGEWRTVSGRRVFMREGVSLTQAMRDSGKFEQTEIKEQKEKPRGDGEEPTEDWLKSYTEGDFDDAYMMSRYMIEGKEYRDLPEMYQKMVTEQQWRDTGRFMDAIHNEPYSKDTLSRFEYNPQREFKVGDTVSFGLASFSADKDFAEKVLSGKDKGLLAEYDSASDFKGVKYVTVGETRSFNMEKYSQFDQKERVISADYKVTKIEYKEVDSNVGKVKMPIVYIEEVR